MIILTKKVREELMREEKIMNKQSLGDRMKQNYENRYRIKLTRRMPVILRLDGKAFHTLTKGCEKPFDGVFQLSMEKTAIKLLKSKGN